jgi:ABC-type Fe3+/spermidine/putrescine transport system ATPase subunit
VIELRRLHKRFPAATPADHLDLTIEDGEFFTLLGASGSGKSTILRMIAGLETPTSGRIVFRGEDITDRPPWKRPFGMIFQQYAIFPHLDVGQNVQYGLSRSVRRRDGARRTHELLALVGLPGYERRSVHQLSGGEQQRVAIARALATSPQVLLLDEPLSALDERIRRDMQTELRALQRKTGMCFVYVTHDQEEALTMSDRIALLNAGRCVQCDRPKTLFQRPRSAYVANFFRGCNVLRAAPDASGSGVLIGGQPVALAGLDPRRYGGEVAVRSEDITLAADAGLATARIRQIVYRGLYSSVHLELADSQTLVASITKADAFREGQTVYFSIEPGTVVPLESQTGE